MDDLKIVHRRRLRRTAGRRYPPSTEKRVTGTIRLRESWKAWDWASERFVRHVSGSFGAAQFPLDHSTKGPPGEGAITAARRGSGRSMASGPLAGGRSGTGPGLHQQRAGLDWLGRCLTQRRSTASTRSRSAACGLEMPGGFHRPPACAMPSYRPAYGIFELGDSPDERGLR